MTTFTSARRPLAAALATGLAAFAAPAFSAEEVNIYTYREPGLIKPLLDEFTKETGIKVNTVFAANGLEERIRTRRPEQPRRRASSPSISAACNRRRITASRSRCLRPSSTRTSRRYRDPEGHWFGVTHCAPASSMPRRTA